MTNTQSPTLDSRWPFPVAVILLHSMILFPCVAILALYAPIVNILASNHDKLKSDRYSFAFGAIVFSGTSAMHVICSFGAMIYSCLSPVFVVVVCTLSTLLWGAAIGGSSVFWQRHKAAICRGDWQADWRCEYGYITLVCTSIATASSLLLVLLSWYTLVKHLRPPNKFPNTKLKQSSTSIIRLGPPSTHPVNLHNPRLPDQSDIGSLLEQGIVSETTARPPRLYNTTQRAEFQAGGIGKLILPQHLDPTSSGFIPGRLLYGPPIPEAYSGDRKGKKPQQQSPHSLASPRRSFFIENGNLQMPQQPKTVSRSNGTSQTSLSSTKSAANPAPVAHPVSSRKLLPALPVRIMDSAVFPVGPSSYFSPTPKPAPFTQQHQRHSDIWQPPTGALTKAVQMTAPLDPPPIPWKHPLRRISSAPPGSLDMLAAQPDPQAVYSAPQEAVPKPKPPRVVTDFSANWGYNYYNGSLPKRDPSPVIAGPSTSTQRVPQSDAHFYPPVQPRNVLPAVTTATSARSPTSGPQKPVISPHTPQRPSNLTSSFTRADIDTSGVDGEYQQQILSAPSEENSWERGVEDLLHRVGYDYDSRSPPRDLPPVASSNTLPQAPHPIAAVVNATTASAAEEEEPKIGPVKREDTFSSEESDDTLAYDPEKMELVEEERATQQVSPTAASQPQPVQEMTEVPESPSLTLPRRGLGHARSISSPTPLHIPSTHPVLQLSHGVTTEKIPRTLPRHLDPENLTGRASTQVVSGSSSTPLHPHPQLQNKPLPTPQQNRYTTVAPLQITKDLPPLPNRPPPPQRKPPPIQTTLAQNHAQIQSNNNNNTSTHNPPSTPRTPRTPIAPGKTQCLGHFTVSPTGEVEMAYRSYDSMSSSHLSAGAGSSVVGGGTVNGTRRKRSKSGPPNLGVRFELGRNEVYAGRTWGTSSSGSPGGEGSR